MAANFEYLINSKDKSKTGIDSAKNNIQGLETVAKRTSQVMKAAFAAVSVKAIITGTGKLLTAYGEQEKVETRLAAAVKNNPYLNGEAAERMIEYAGALQKSSVFGDEAIIQQQSMLAGLGLTESQIKDVTTAAVDLASTGMFSLESATRNIAKTMSGMTGELGEAIPALRELTTEELKAGKAVDVIKAQYAGMGEALASTTEGLKTQFSNLMVDVAETLGGTLAPAFSGLLNDLTPILENFQNWINENRVFIINFFSNIPELAATAFSAVAELLSTIFSMEYLKSLGSALWEFFLESGQAALQAIGSVLSAIGTSIWLPLKFGWESMIYAIKSNFATFLDWFIIKINTLVEKGQKVGLFKKAGEIQLATAGIGAAPTMDTEDILDAWRNVGETFRNTSVTMKEAGAVLGQDISNPLKDVFNAAIPEFRDILTQPVPPSASAGVTGGATGADAGGAVVVAEETVSALSSFSSAVMGSISGIQSLYMSIQGVANIFGFVTTIITAFIGTIEGTLNQFLSPIVGYLVLIGESMGQLLIPILQALIPILDFLMWSVLNMWNWGLRPVMNLVIGVFQSLAWIIGSVANALITFAEVITGNKYKKYKVPKVTFSQLDKISLPELKEKSGLEMGGAEDYTTTETAGTAAQYTAGRTVNQTVNIYTDAIAGDGGLRQLAIMIRDEIYAAEALGA